MKFVYILEDDPKFQKEMCEAIAFVDPLIQIRIFPKLETFAAWIKLVMTKGPAAIIEGGEVPGFVPQEPLTEGEAHQLVLVISKIEFLGVEQLELLRKTRQLFVDRKICTTEDPTAFVLTAFDNPNFKITELENRILNNVIFKPFDRLILTQHLTFAIDGRHPPSKYTVANQKTKAVVEMLKDVEIEAISDVGFVSKSYREIQPGSVSKYYGEIFLSDRQRSLFAICRSCVPHPEQQGAFQCAFTFFAADQTQISSVRKKTRAKEAIPFSYPWKSPQTRTSNVHILLLDEEEETPSGLQGLIPKKFGGVKITTYRSFSELIFDLDPQSALQNRDASLKALGGATSVTLEFDSSGATYIGFDSDKKDLATIFGVPLSEWKTKSNWLSHAIAAEHREKYRKYVQTGQLGNDNILPILSKDISFLVKVDQVRKEGEKFHITLTEPAKEEQVKWLLQNSKLKDPVHLVIANHRLFGEGAKERWSFVKEGLKNRFQTEAKIFMTSKRDFTDAEERELGTFVDDVFFKPLDRVYLFQKMKVLIPQLQERVERVEIKDLKVAAIIKAANPVHVSEISEAGIVIQYYRPVTLGSFREFVLWQPYEIGAPELLATCNFVEESQSEKGSFNCHMVFFGISDLYLKAIRVWIRDNYVLSKESQAS